MARKIDFENLSNEDLLYLSTREWLVQEAEFLGIEGVRERVNAALSGEVQEEEEEEEDGEEEIPDYEAWKVEDLKAELKNRELDDSGKKPQLIARLVADDEEEEEED